MTNPLCPLGCGVPVPPWRLEAHLQAIHPQHQIHLLPPIDVCPHLSFQGAVLMGPQAPFGVPMTVN